MSWLTNEREKAIRLTRSLSTGLPFSVILSTALALAGCAGQQPADPEPRVVRVEVPVLVPCRTQPVAVPPWAAAGLRKGDSLEVKIRALLAERRQRIGYERELAAANEACR